MALIVQKYGGTSVRDLRHIDNVANKIVASKNAGNDVIVVVSAMADETDRLHDLAKTITTQPNARELDVLLAAGEQINIALLSIALNNKNCAAISFLGSQAKIITDNMHNKARILSIDTHSIKNALNNGKVCVVAGFQGVDQHGNITTLGRGGSDLTAVALAAALGACECQIYTDVDGIYNADPKIVPNAKQLNSVHINEMLESAGLGTKVLQHRAVDIANKHKVPVRVLSNSGNSAGTLIEHGDYCFDLPAVSGIAFNRTEAKFIIRDISNTTNNIATKVIAAISNANIEIDMMVLDRDLMFAVNRTDLTKTMAIITALKVADPKKIVASDTVSKVSLVGSGIRSNASVVNKVFATLDENNIAIELISASEMRISILLDESHLEDAVRILHSSFNLEVKPKEGIAA